MICIERLAQIIDEAVDRGDWKPIKCSRYGPELSNLFFTNDIVLFAEASIQRARVIKKCLDIFCRASGQ